MASESAEKTVTVDDISKLSEDMASLYLSREFSDVTFILDGQPLYAHKQILATRSDYFKCLVCENNQSENVVIDDISRPAFKNLLKYIYTGKISISEDVALTLEALGFAHRHLFEHLKSKIIKNLKFVINVKNICAVLNTANLYDLDELRDICHSFMDLNSDNILSGDCLNSLTEKSMIKLLERDTFLAPEIEIFNTVSKWCKANDEVDKLVIEQCVRLSLLTVTDILSVVWPSKLFDNEQLLESMAERFKVKSKISQSRGLLILYKNIATPQHKAEVLSGTNTSLLLAGNRDIDKYAHHQIDGESSITIKLGSPTYFNHIRMMLWEGDKASSYSYYIEVSLDQQNWRKIIDYSTFRCRSVQALYFDQQVAQYIRLVGVVGTINTTGPDFRLVYFELYLKDIIPKVINGIICPDTNVATIGKNAMVIKGDYPENLLNGDMINYNGGKGYSRHYFQSDPIVVQLAQPYMVSTMRLLLWDKDDRYYRYFIETSINNTDWEVEVDRKEENSKSWQDISFDERVVVFIRITGTYNSDKGNTGFHVVHFECPSQS